MGCEHLPVGLRCHCCLRQLATVVEECAAITWAIKTFVNSGQLKLPAKCCSVIFGLAQIHRHDTFSSVVARVLSRVAMDPTFGFALKPGSNYY